VFPGSEEGAEGGEAGSGQRRPTSRKIGSTSQSMSEKREEFFCPNFNRKGYLHFSKFVFFSGKKCIFYYNNPFTYVQKVAVVVLTKCCQKTKQNSLPEKSFTG
jgi:hypothetical protein